MKPVGVIGMKPGAPYGFYLKTSSWDIHVGYPGGPMAKWESGNFFELQTGESEMQKNLVKNPSNMS